MATIDDEVAAAMKWARAQCGKTPAQWARELNRLVPPISGSTWLDEHMVEAIEDGEMAVLAAWLVAAARLVEQPVSVILGETEAYEVTMPALERRIGELEARLESAGLA